MTIKDNKERAEQWRDIVEQFQMILLFEILDLVMP